MPRGISKNQRKKGSNWVNPVQPNRVKNKESILSLNGIVNFNFKPYTEFRMENRKELTSEDVYLKPILKDGKTIGVLISADKYYIYGIISMDKIIVELEIDLGKDTTPELAKKFEDAFGTDEMAPAEDDIENQRVIKKEKPKYNKYNQKISQKTNYNDLNDYEDEDEDNTED